MYTKTSREILEPIAEAVSQLILINSEAELHQRPLPDLREAGKAVQHHTNELVTIGQRLSQNESCEPDVRNGITNANVGLTNAGAMLHETTELLFKAPTSFESRQKLFESIKHIMYSVGELLKAYDDYEISKVLRILHQTKRNLTQLKVLDSIEAIIPVLKETCQLLVQVAHQTTARIEELLNETHQVQLRYAVEMLGKDSPQLVSTIKLSLQFAQDANTKTGSVEMCDSIIHTLDIIERVVQDKDAGPPEDDLFGIYYALDDSIQSYGNAVASGDKELAARRISEYTNLHDKLVSFYTEALAHDSGNALESATDALGQLLAVSDELLDNHEQFLNAREPEQCAGFADKVKNSRAKATSAFLLAEKAFHRAVAGKVLSSNAMLVNGESHSSLLSRIENSARQGDQGYLQRLLDDFQQQSAGFRRQAALVEQYQGFDMRRETFADDGGLAASIKLNSDRLETLQSRLASAAQSLSLHSSDPVAQEHYTNVTEVYRTTGATLAHLMLHGDAPVPNESGSAGSVHEHVQLGIPYSRHSVFGDSKTRSAARLGAIIESTLEWVRDVTQDIADNGGDAKQAQERLQVARRVLQETKQEFEQNKDLIAADPGTTAKFVSGWTQLEAVFSAISSTAGTSDADREQIRSRAREVANLVNQMASLVSQNKKLVEGASKDPSKDVLVVNNVSLVVVDDNGAPNTSSSRGADGSVLLVDRTTAALIQKGEIDIVDEAAPAPLSVAEAATNPIKAAALDLRVETARWSKKDNTLLQIVDSLVGKLCELGDFHKQLHSLTEAASRRASLLGVETNEAEYSKLDEARNAAAVKRGFISGTTDLLHIAQKFAQETEPIILHCSDSRLKLQLKSIMERLLTLVQQLKILAAVKAASPSDTDSEVQIVTCARNIVNAINTALQFAESATLRMSTEELALVKPIGTELETRRRSKILAQPDSSDPNLAESKSETSPLTALPKFKRQIYTKSSDGGAANTQPKPVAGSLPLRSRADHVL